MKTKFRSMVGYGVLGCFLTELDESLSVDGLLYQILVDDNNYMTYTEVAHDIGHVNLYCLINDLIDSVVAEVERDI